MEVRSSAAPTLATRVYSSNKTSPVNPEENGRYQPKQYRIKTNLEKGKNKPIKDFYTIA